MPATIPKAFISYSNDSEAKSQLRNFNAKPTMINNERTRLCSVQNVASRL